MYTCHLLLGRPWQYDRHVKHNGFHNTYSFKKYGLHIILAPLDIRDSATQALILPKSDFLEYSRNIATPFLLTLVVTEANHNNAQMHPQIEPLIA